MSTAMHFLKRKRRRRRGERGEREDMRRKQM
jgi:hypothetical protein